MFPFLKTAESPLGRDNAMAVPEALRPELQGHAPEKTLWRVKV